MVVRAVLVLIAAGLLLAAAWGMLSAFTSLDFDALSPVEAAAIAAALIAPLAIASLMLILRTWQRSARSSFLRALGLHGEDTLEGDLWTSVRLTAFESPGGERRDAWLIEANQRGLGLPRMVVMPASAEVPDYAAELLPNELARGWIARTEGGRPPPVEAAQITAIPELIQVRTYESGARVILARPLQSARSLRAGIVLARSLIGRPLQAPEPAEVPVAALERKPLSFKIAGGAFGLWFVVFLVVANLSPDREGYEDFILERVQSCNLAVEALGAPIERRQLGIQPGGQHNRRVSSVILLHGSRADDEVEIDSYRRKRYAPSRTNVIKSAILTGAGIDVLPCAKNATRGVRGPKSLRGRVTEAEAQSGLATGAECTIELAPHQSPQFPICRVEVRCGEKLLYGVRSDLGFTDCWTDQGRIVARDPDRGLPRSEATLDLDERVARVIIGLPSRVVIALEADQ